MLNGKNCRPIKFNALNNVISYIDAQLNKYSAAYFKYLYYLVADFNLLNYILYFILNK